MTPLKGENHCLRRKGLLMEIPLAGKEDLNSGDEAPSNQGSESRRNVEDELEEGEVTP